MGKRQLAYEILHHKDGTFVLLEIEGSGREIAELERRMRVNDRVLRYITVRVDEDRRRAAKLKERRARKAAKRPAHGGSSAPRRGPAMDFAEAGE
jgi:small subunit ribosomal protein S6